jgi:hypothetical protein
VNILKIVWDGQDFLEKGASFYSGAKILNHLKYYYIRHTDAVKLLWKVRNCSPGNLNEMKEEVELFLREER